MTNRFPNFLCKRAVAGLFLFLFVFPAAQLFSQTGNVTVNSTPSGAEVLYCIGAGCNPTTSSLPSVTNFSNPAAVAGIWRGKYVLSGYADSTIYEQTLPPGGSITFNHTFTALQPTLTSLTPASGNTGSRVTITLNGGNFNSQTKVRVYDYLNRFEGELSAATQPQDGSWTFTLVDSTRITIVKDTIGPYGTRYLEAVNDTLASSKVAYSLLPNTTPNLQLIQALPSYTDSLGGTHQVDIYRLNDWRSGYPVHFMLIRGHTLNGAHSPYPLIVGALAYPAYSLFPAPPSTDPADIAWSATPPPTTDVSLPASSENRQCFSPATCWGHTNYPTFNELSYQMDWALKNGYAVAMPYTRFYAARDFLSGPYEIISVIEALKTFSDIDPARIGQLGGSLGGYLTAYTLSRPDKPLAIKAAVAAYAPIDFRALETYYFESLNTLHPTDALRHASQDFATPYVNRMYRSMGRTESSAWDAMSNNNTASDLTTPLLLYGGTDDMMVPPSEVTNLYNSAKANGKQVNKYIYQNGPPLFATKSAKEVAHGVLDTNSPVKYQTVLNENFFFYKMPPDVASIPRAVPGDGDLIAILSQFRTEICAAPAEKSNLSDIISAMANPKISYTSSDPLVPSGSGPTAVAAAINYVWSLEGVSWTAANVTANLQAGSLPTTCSATKVNINSTPAGAGIWAAFNGGAWTDLSAVTPYVYTSVAPGSWRIKLVKTGYQNWEQTQELPPGGEITFSGALTPADITAPVISGVGSSNISNAAVTIAWTTDEASDSQVEYGLSTSYGTLTALNAGMVTSHSAGLAGLTGSTTYHYRVKSKDAAANPGVSGDYTFTTSAAPDITAPVITGVGSSNISNTAATISWATDEASDSQVEYGLSTSYTNSTTLNISMVTSHSAGLSGLTGSTTYHYRVRSKDAALNQGASGDHTFTTSAAPDITAPVITGVGSSNITNAAAAISWTTDEASDSQVEYGTSLSYGNSTALNASMVTSHSAGLSGLAASTLYYYRVRSKDAALNTGTSGDYTFTTSAAPDNTAPVITGVGSSNINNAAATISWTTNEASNSQVEYGLSASYGNSTALNAAMVTSHSAGLAGLTGSTTYHYRVRSRDATLNLGTSGDYTFTTSATPDTTPPVFTSVGSSLITYYSASIDWTTNEASNSQVEYGLTTSYGALTALNADMVTSHSAALAGLAAGTLYHYRVRSRDAALNQGASGDYTFTTYTIPTNTPPTIGVDSPWSGATLSGTVGVTATAWDDAGVAKVDFIMGGTTYSDNAAPYSHQLNTLRSANGWRQLTVRAYDINSNTAETVLDLRVQNQDRTDTIVTSTGGAILSSIADIIVPPMSLAAPITITVVDEAMDDDALLDERRARASLQDITPIALGVRLLPDGYIPAGPISIKLPLNHSIKVAATMEEIIGLYSWNDTLNTWQLLTSTYSAADDSMNAQTAAFSVYRLFSRVPLVLTPAVGEVYVFPNPAKGEAKPVFHIETDSADKVEIRIHDFTGRQIHTKTITAGPALVNRNNKLTYAYEYEWEAGNAASGAYFYVVIVSKGGGKTLRKGKFAVIR